MRFLWASARVSAGKIKKVLSRRKELHALAVSPQQRRQRLSDVSLIVHDIDKLICRFHECLLRNKHLTICGPAITVQSGSGYEQWDLGHLQFEASAIFD
jgi:hypothetical protein